MPRQTSLHHWTLVLAGGDGTRLQELTREVTGAPIPKQHCRLLGARSLLEASLDRARHVTPTRRILIVVNSNHLAVGRDQLDSVPVENVLVQPCNRDTGPGLLFALQHLAQSDPHAIVVVMPSDHYVGDDGAFAAHVARAICLVQQLPDKVVLLGIRPDYPETGYGYVKPSQRVWTGRSQDAAFSVAAFAEKPSRELARQILNGGGLWNSFVMVFQVCRMLTLIEAAVPGEYARLRTAAGRPLGEFYDTLPRWNFSSVVLARIPEHLLVLRVDDVHWSDWGTRASIERTLVTLNQPPPWQMGKRGSVAA
jgi:mannose-1-phosphate guanylyltransferase